MTANGAELRENLLFILGGNWERLEVPEFPFTAPVTVVCAPDGSASTGRIPADSFSRFFDREG
jgi:hypothetical protein